VPAKLGHLTVFDHPAAGASEPHDLLRNAPQPVVTAITAPPAPTVDNWMTIRQAEEAGMLPRNWTKPGGAFRTAKHRAAKEGIPVPPVRGKKGSEAMYDAVELADFLERITERQAA